MSTGTVLVTGVTGMLGRAVAKSLLAQGRSVLGMDLNPPRDLPIPFLAHALPEPQRWHEAIVGSGVTQIVHAGGVSGPMVLRDDPKRICDINLGGLIELLEAARIHRLGRVVWFSSIGAYGSQPRVQPIGDNTPMAPDTVYGATKAAGEAVISAYRAEHGVDAVALRVTSCYGPGRTTDCVIRTILEDALDGRTTLVRDDPGRTRQHVFVDDVVAATQAALDARELTQTSYNIAPGRTQSLAEITDAIRQIMPSVSVRADPDGMAWNTFAIGPLSIEAARRDLGFEPRTPLKVGADRTLAWIRERRSL